MEGTYNIHTEGHIHEGDIHMTWRRHIYHTEGIYTWRGHTTEGTYVRRGHAHGGDRGDVRREWHTPGATDTAKRNTHGGP